jgi:hypothetical protein
VPFRDGGEWHLWPTLLAGAMGLAALAFSVYVIYALELVRLSGPRSRSREDKFMPTRQERRAAR